MTSCAITYSVHWSMRRVCLQEFDGTALRQFAIDCYASVRTYRSQRVVHGAEHWCSLQVLNAMAMFTLQDKV